MSTIYSVPRDGRHHKYKKVLYLEPPINGSKTVRTRVTTVIPAAARAPSPSPPPPPRRSPAPAPAPYLPEPMPEPQPPIIVAPPPPPPPPAPALCLPPHPRTPPPPEPEPDTAIEVIAVDVDPSEDSPPRRAKSHKSHKSSRSSHSVHSSHSSHSNHSSHSSSSSRRSHSRGPSLDREIYVEREKIVPYRVPVPYPVHLQPEYETYRYVEGTSRSPSRHQSSPDREIIIEDRRRRRYIRD